MRSYLHPRDELLLAIERIYRYRMTTTSGGNLSLREPDGSVWITPARLDKGGLEREDMVRVGADGTLEGTRAPSSELPFHLEIYRRRPDLGGIVHAHSGALVAFSLAHEVPNTHLFHQSRDVCGDAGFAPYRLPGSAALGDALAATFAQGFNCVVLENHGVVTAGATFQDAFRRFEALEFTAKTIIKGRLLGTVRYLSEEQIALAARQVTGYEQFEPADPSSAEKELRGALGEFTRRAYRQRLFISTQGSYSARLDSTSFLITPYRADRGTLDAGDLVLVSGGRVEAAKTPSRAWRSHEAIYRRHPGVGAVINAYPVNATAFSVTGTRLDTRTIPESYIVARQPGWVPYGLHFEDHEALARNVSPSQPVAILENDGVLATGAGVLEAFDRLEVVESTAEAIINCRAVGTLAPLSEDAIRELEAAFLK